MPDDSLSALATDDTGSVLVVILKGETKPCDNNIQNLKWVFSDPFFTVQVCEVKPPPDIPINSPLTEAEYIENYVMRQALTFAAEGPYVINADGTRQPEFCWTQLPCIIVKDSSVSNVTPQGTTIFDHPDPDDNFIGGMKERIQVALDQASQANLYFLHTYRDKCDIYVDVKGVGNIAKGSTLKWTVQPNSLQAIMYTPATRDFVRNALVTSNVALNVFLNKEIALGNLLAVTFVPNIIDFDIDLAVTSNDFEKMDKCERVFSQADQSEGSSFIWFAIIVALVILVAWALITVGPQYATV